MVHLCNLEKKWIKKECFDCTRIWNIKDNINIYELIICKYENNKNLMKEFRKTDKSMQKIYSYCHLQNLNVISCDHMFKNQLRIKLYNNDIYNLFKTTIYSKSSIIIQLYIKKSNIKQNKSKLKKSILFFIIYFNSIYSLI